MVNKVKYGTTILFVLLLLLFGFLYFLIDSNNEIKKLETTVKERNIIISNLQSELTVKSTAEVVEVMDTKYDFILPIDLEDFIAPSSPFGIREVPRGIYTGGAPERFHNALDLYGVWKARIVASADGKIKDKWYVPDEKKGRKGHPIYGGLIIIAHPDGSETSYGHLSWISEDLHEGDFVKQGDFIGRQGSTGMSTNGHLDFSIKIDGKYVNPLKYIKLEENNVQK